MKKDKRKKGQKKKANVKKAPKRSEYITTLKELASMGSVDALYSLGIAYINGDTVKVNPEKAFEYFKEAAVRGHPDAMFCLGSMYVTGEANVRDLEQAKLWLHQAASLGVEGALEVLPNLERDFTVIEGDRQKVEERKQRYEKGDGDAAYDLAHFYESAKDQEKADFYRKEAERLRGGKYLIDQGNKLFREGHKEEALKIYAEALDAGKYEAYVRIGCALFINDFSDESRAVGMQYMKRAREHGVKEASIYLTQWTYDHALTEKEFAEALVYAKEGVEAEDRFGYMSDTLQKFYSEKIYDDETVLSLTKTMANHGDEASIARAAYMYLTGEGTPRNLKEGLKYLQKSYGADDSTCSWLIDILEKRPKDVAKAFDQYAKNADEYELFDIAKCYLNGTAVDQDLKKGLHYLQEAADQHVLAAQSLLGEILLLGHYGVEKDEEKALTYICDAADYNDPRACNLLSRCYDTGTGVEYDGVKSHEYYVRFAGEYEDDYE